VIVWTIIFLSYLKNVSFQIQGWKPNTRKQMEILSVANVQKVIPILQVYKSMLISHHLGRKFVCDICRLAFSYKSNFNRHVKNKHSMYISFQYISNKMWKCLVFSYCKYKHVNVSGYRYQLPCNWRWLQSYPDYKRSLKAVKVRFVTKCKSTDITNKLPSQMVTNQHAFVDL
jgi:hypothetical protein